MTAKSELAHPIHQLPEYSDPIVAMIMDETRGECRGPALRARMVELHHVYGGTILAYSLGIVASKFQEARQLVRVEIDDTSSTQHLERLDSSFYLGALLAVHSHVRQFNTSARTHILNQGCNWNYETDGYSQQDQESQYDIISCTLLDSEDEVNEWLGSQEEELQEAILGTAVSAFTDYPSQIASRYENDFVFGFKFSSESIMTEYCKYVGLSL